MNGQAGMPLEIRPERPVAPLDLGLDAAALRRTVRRPFRIGMGLMTVFLGGFTAWAVTVPIAGGAVAPGVVSPDGSRRTVQHLEGGIIASLAVRDGDRVLAGQPLVVLESVQARAAFNALQNQYVTLRAMQARLRAEQAGLMAIDLPDDVLTALSDRELALIVQAQRSLFETRRAAHESKRAVLRQRIEQSREQIRGAEAQIASATEQLSLIADELRGKETLLRRGLVPRPEVLRLRRVQAEIEGRRGEYQGTVARTQQQIGEAEMQILGLDAERADQVSQQLDQVRAELAGVTERLNASRDVLTRTVVTAPVPGTVVGMRFRTVDGVVRPGEAILDIVPAEEKLLVDARVAPTDVDVVRNGMQAQVRFTAFAGRNLPRIEGTVRSVSADRLTDDSTRQPYYLARVEVTREALASLGREVELVPGMPAEVLIVRRERTMMDYLIEPLRDAFRRSFREV
ncbi:HlyD family type I secretion periplasmic adaptor subunit [Falsiroseomonas sp. CW058]|uniref:HlyD family type I secretion periplasmic adaptor subunit n=1 Tax=Falsiroseomonas sp. CW058 TaxID=3388664 RepID=UPI003D31B99C